LWQCCQMSRTNSFCCDVGIQTLQEMQWLKKVFNWA
jgi:hypothetical protein